MWCFAQPIELSAVAAPPFFSEKLPEGGAASFAAKEIFKSMGYELKIGYYPVRRAKIEAIKNPEIMGYVPCSADDVVDGLVLSSTVYKTQTLIIENIEKPITWSKPEDLGKLRGSIGIGYPLRGQFKTVYEKGQLNIEESPDDVSGLLKVANQRLDYVFMTDGMYKFILEADPRVKAIAAKLHVNPKPAALIDWGVCFKDKSVEISKIMKDFNKKIDPTMFPRLVGEYLKKRQMAAAAQKKGP